MGQKAGVWITNKRLDRHPESSSSVPSTRSDNARMNDAYREEKDTARPDTTTEPSMNTEVHESK